MHTLQEVNCTEQLISQVKFKMFAKCFEMGNTSKWFASFKDKCGDVLFLSINPMKSPKNNKTSLVGYSSCPQTIKHITEPHCCTSLFPTYSIAPSLQCRMWLNPQLKIVHNKNTIYSCLSYSSANLQCPAAVLGNYFTHLEKKLHVCELFLKICFQ